MTEAGDRSRRLRWVLVALLAAHVGLLAWGIFDPEASLRFDRTGRRIASARMLVGAAGPAEVAEVLRTRGAPGDYAWQAVVLGPTGESLAALQIVQLLLAGLSIFAVHRIAGTLAAGLGLRAASEIAWLAAVLYAAIPIDFAIPHFLASEAFFNPLLVFGVAALVRYGAGRAGLGSIAGAGLCFGLAAVTRPEGLPWLLVMFGIAVPLVWSRVRTRVRAQAALHLATLALLTFVPIGLYLGLATSEPVRLERASLSLEWELANRAQRVLAPADADEVAVIEAKPAAAFVRAALERPGAFTREWALQVGKLLVLPDNLDLFRYLGAYAYTGKRSDWVHEYGVVGTARRVFEEMPGLASWLALTVLLWLAVLWLAARGAADMLRRTRGSERLLVLLLLSLPVVWTGLRVLTQGESRKRSPVDFAIAIFAAFGAMRTRYASRRPTTCKASEDAPTRGERGGTS